MRNRLWAPQGPFNWLQQGTSTGHPLPASSCQKLPRTCASSAIMRAACRAQQSMPALPVLLLAVQSPATRRWCWSPCLEELRTSIPCTNMPEMLGPT